MEHRCRTLLQVLSRSIKRKCAFSQVVTMIRLTLRGLLLYKKSESLIIKEFGLRF
ncbi:MAG: hypothetical protein E7119_08905 [Bacteroidales bacterium]|nr:hypothetical protein [Bacteroidales bacterium]